MRHFLDAIAGRAEYPMTLDEELHDVEVYHAVMRSHESGREERVGQ
jgi:hypothetical protein